MTLIDPRTPWSAHFRALQRRLLRRLAEHMLIHGERWHRLSEDPPPPQPPKRPPRRPPRRNVH